MYGTVSRFQIKPGAQDKLMAHMRSYRDMDIPGYIGEVVYQSDDDPTVFTMAVVFQDKATYVANAEDPAQDARYREWRELLVSDPEWHDGEIVWSSL